MVIGTTPANVRPGKRYKGMMTPEERRALGIIILSLMQCNGFVGSRVTDLRILLEVKLRFL